MINLLIRNYISSFGINDKSFFKEKKIHGEPSKILKSSFSSAHGRLNQHKLYVLYKLHFHLLHQQQEPDGLDIVVPARKFKSLVLLVLPNIRWVVVAINQSLWMDQLLNKRH